MAFGLTATRSSSNVHQTGPRIQKPFLFRHGCGTTRRLRSPLAAITTIHRRTQPLLQHPRARPTQRPRRPLALRPAAHQLPNPIQHLIRTLHQRPNQPAHQRRRLAQRRPVRQTAIRRANRQVIRRAIRRANPKARAIPIRIAHRPVPLCPSPSRTVIPNRIRIPSPSLSHSASLIVIQTALPKASHGLTPRACQTATLTASPTPNLNRIRIRILSRTPCQIPTRILTRTLHLNHILIQRLRPAPQACLIPFRNLGLGRCRIQILTPILRPQRPPAP